MEGMPLKAAFRSPFVMRLSKAFVFVLLKQMCMHAHFICALLSPKQKSWPEEVKVVHLLQNSWPLCIVTRILPSLWHCIWTHSLACFLSRFLSLGSASVQNEYLISPRVHYAAIPALDMNPDPSMAAGMLVGQSFICFSTNIFLVR